MVFVQLSKIQKKDLARHERQCRNQHKHDEAHPNAQAMAQARQEEIRALTMAQAADKLRNAEVQTYSRERVEEMANG